MFGRAARALADLQGRERAVGRDRVGPVPLDLVEHGRADLHRQREVLGLHAPGPVVARALLDGQDLGAGDEREQVAGLEADVLHLEVAGDLVEHASGASLEIERELSRRVAPHQVLAEVQRRVRDEARLGVGSEHRVLLLQRQAAGRARHDDRVARARRTAGACGRCRTGTRWRNRGPRSPETASRSSAVSGTATSQPFFSSTATAARATSGAL